MEGHRSVVFICKFCKLVFQFPNDLIQHKTQEHRKELKMVKAQLGITKDSGVGQSLLQRCESSPIKESKDFPRPNSMEIINLKTPTKLDDKSKSQAFQFKCGFCDKLFKYPSALRQHENHHIKPFACNNSECRRRHRKFARKTDLEKHMLKDHDSPQVIVTKRANHRQQKEQVRSASNEKVPTRKGKLSHHLQLDHDGYKAYRCGKCLFASTHSKSLRRHLNCHVEKNQFKCTKCSASFKGRHYMNKHLRECHVPTVKVTTTVTSSSKSQTNLKSTPAGKKRKPRSEIKCQICDELIVNKFLEHFMSRHPGEKPYKCEDCPYGTFQRRDLEKHVILHRRRRKVKCDFCTATFSNASHKGFHSRGVHVQELPEVTQKSVSTRESAVPPEYHAPSRIMENQTRGKSAETLFSPDARAKARSCNDVQIRSAVTFVSFEASHIGGRGETSTPRLQQRSHQPKVFQCSICKGQFTMMDELKIHFDSDCRSAGMSTAAEDPSSKRRGVQLDVNQMDFLRKRIKLEKVDEEPEVIFVEEIKPPSPVKRVPCLCQLPQELRVPSS